MMKKVLCTLLMAAFISPLWAAETEAAPEQKLMPAITADTGGNELGVDFRIGFPHGPARQGQPF